MTIYTMWDYCALSSQNCQVQDFKGAVIPVFWGGPGKILYV